MTDLIVPAPLVHPGRLLRGIQAEINRLDRDSEKLKEDGFSGEAEHKAAEVLRKVSTDIVTGRFDAV